MAIPSTTNPQVSSTTGGGPSITAYNVATSGGKLVVFVCFEKNDPQITVASVTRNGQSFAFAGRQILDGGSVNNVTECWYLDNPSTGSYDIAVTYTASTINSSTMSAVYMTGAATGAPDATGSNGYASSSGPYTASISPTVNDTLILAAIGAGARETLTVSGAGHTELASILENLGGVYLSASYKQAASSGANSVDWTSSGSNNRIAIFAAAWAGAGGNIEESISLGVSAGVASGSIAAAGGAISVGLSAGVADQGRSGSLGGLNLAMQTGVAFAGAAGALDSLSIGLSAGVAFAQQAGTLGTVSLGLSHGQSLASASAAIAALSFGIGHGLAISTSSTGAVEESISLAIASGIAAKSASITSGALTLSFDIGLGFLTGQQIDEAISLGLVSGISGAGTALAVASLTIDLDAHTAAAAQASAIGAITIGQAIGQALATSIGGVSTPDSRIIAVDGQKRTITIDADGRKIIVRAQTRIIDV